MSREIIEALRYAAARFDSNKLDEAIRFAERNDWDNAGVSLRQFFEDMEVGDESAQD